jgi:hypothetical protein
MNNVNPMVEKVIKHINNKLLRDYKNKYQLKVDTLNQKLKIY